MACSAGTLKANCMWFLRYDVWKRDRVLNFCSSIIIADQHESCEAQKIQCSLFSEFTICTTLICLWEGPLTTTLG